MRHAGDLGNLQSDALGNCNVELEDKLLTLHGALSIVGRSVIMCALQLKRLQFNCCPPCTAPQPSSGPLHSLSFPRNYPLPLPPPPATRRRTTLAVEVHSPSLTFNLHVMW
jgi:hypothetical protein